MGKHDRNDLLLDANVLIDFLNSDPTVLTLVATRIGKVHVSTIVLDEVKNLTEADCVSLGLTLIEPNLDQISRAVVRRPGLSFQDQLCLVICQDFDWVCVTNDTRLRRQCEQDGVRYLWGLQLLTRLVRTGNIPVESARNIVVDIHRSNPKHITSNIVQRFLDDIGWRPPNGNHPFTSTQ